MSMVAPPSGRPVVASVLSLVGGILILVGSLFFLLIGFGYFFVGALLGLACAIVVIISAAAMYAKPSQHVAWGVIILIFSIVSLFGFGGFVAGMALGITGGAIGMAWGIQPPGYGGAYAMPLAGMYMGPYGARDARRSGDNPGPVPDVPRRGGVAPRVQEVVLRHGDAVLLADLDARAPLARLLRGLDLDGRDRDRRGQPEVPRDHRRLRDAVVHDDREDLGHNVVRHAPRAGPFPHDALRLALEEDLALDPDEADDLLVRAVVRREPEVHGRLLLRDLRDERDRAVVVDPQVPEPVPGLEEPLAVERRELEPFDGHVRSKSRATTA